MKLNKNAWGVIRKLGETEIAIAFDKKFPHEEAEIYIKTRIKKGPSAQDLIDSTKLKQEEKWKNKQT